MSVAVYIVLKFVHLVYFNIHLFKCGVKNICRIFLFIVQTLYKQHSLHLCCRILCLPVYVKNIGHTLTLFQCIALVVINSGLIVKSHTIPFTT